MGVERCGRPLANTIVIAKDLDPFVALQYANDFGVHPGNGLELSRPVGLVMRPRDPCRVVTLPFCGHQPGLPRRNVNCASPRDFHGLCLSHPM
jgi:hypothetical protein